MKKKEVRGFGRLDYLFQFLFCGGNKLPYFGTLNTIRNTEKHTDSDSA